MLKPRSSAISARPRTLPRARCRTRLSQPIVLRVAITLGRGFPLARPAVAPGDVSPHARRWPRVRAGRLAARTADACGPRVVTAS